MTTGAAAENTAGRAGDKEKVEKRRALGRGLESLLPGPRVVVGTARPAGAPTSTRGDATAAAGELDGEGREAAGLRAGIGVFVAGAAGGGRDGATRGRADEHTWGCHRRCRRA